MARRRRLAVWALLVPLFVAAAGCLREFEQPHFVSIAKVDLQTEDVGATELELLVTTYLDNRGAGETHALKLLAKAYDERTGFLLTQEETEVGTLPGDTTRAVGQVLQVPREGSVRIEVTLYESGLATKQASVSARNLDVLKPEVFDTGLEISEMDFTVAEQGGNGTRPRIEAALYLTNEGGAPSEDLRVQVKAREVTTQLVADTQWLQTGAIAPGTTVIRTVNLSVPDEYNYAVEILTWRGDVIVDRAEGRVQLAPTYEKPKDQEVVITDPNIGDFARPTAPTGPTSNYVGGGTPMPGEPVGVPAPAAAAALAALALVALLARRRRA